MPLRDTLARLKEATANPKAVVERWRQAVDGLYKLVQNTLREYQLQQLITAQRSPILCQEEGLGDYEIDELQLTAGQSTIYFRPVATIVSDGHGRVDMFRHGFRQNRYMLLWKGGVTTAPGWRIAHVSRSDVNLPFNRATLEQVLNELLTQV